MTHALLILRTGKGLAILEGPLPVNEAIEKWKKAVNADLAVPPGPSDPNPPSIEVVELVARRTHKVRGNPIQPKTQPESGSQEPPPVDDAGSSAGGSAAAEEPAAAGEDPPADPPAQTEEAPPADPPRGKRKS